MVERALAAYFEEYESLLHHRLYADRTCGHGNGFEEETWKNNVEAEPETARRV
jgi:hypothetical protein